MLIGVSKNQIAIWDLESFEAEPVKLSIKFQFTIMHSILIENGSNCHKCKRMLRYLILATDHGIFKQDFNCLTSCDDSKENNNLLKPLQLISKCVKSDKILTSKFSRIIAVVGSISTHLLDTEDCKELQLLNYTCEQVRVSDGYIIFWDPRGREWCLVDLTGDGIVQTLQGTPLSRPSQAYHSVIADDQFKNKHL
jgi:hypothetical protein